MEAIGLKTGVNRNRAIIELSKVSGRWCQGCKMRWLIEAGIAEAEAEAEADEEWRSSRCKKYKTVFD